MEQLKCCEKIKTGKNCKNNAKIDGRCTVHDKIHKAKGGECITITFGDVAENHVRMQKLGKMAEHGIECDLLRNAKKLFEKEGHTCELIDLTEGLKDTEHNYEGEAYILIIRNGLKLFCDPDECFEGQKRFEWDTKAKMRGKVVNKKARYNLCYSDDAQEPDYENGKGRVVKFDTCKCLNSIRKTLPKYLGNQCSNLMAEGNRYYDVNQCGIGFHLDFFVFIAPLKSC